MESIKQFHNVITGQVNINKGSSELFLLNNRVEQVVYSYLPYLASSYIAVLDKAYKLNSKGVYIQTRPGAALSNLSQFEANPKTRQHLLVELMLADDACTDSP